MHSVASLWNSERILDNDRLASSLTLFCSFDMEFRRYTDHVEGSERVDREIFAQASMWACAASLFVIAWVIWGKPSFPAFSLIKIVILAGGVGGAWFFSHKSRWLTPLALGSILLGIFHFSAHLRREEWANFNYAMFALMAVAVAWQLVELISSKKKLSKTLK